MRSSLDTIPDCAYVRFGHESCTRRHCHAALMSIDSTLSLAETNKPSGSFSKGTLKKMWRRVKSLKPKPRLWTSLLPREHIRASPSPSLESMATDSMAAKRVLLQRRRTPLLQPLSSTNLQREHSSFTSISYRANSSTSRPTWTSSSHDYHHEQHPSWSSIESDPRRHSGSPRPRLLLDHPYYHPYRSQSFSPVQSSTGSEWMAHLSTTPLTHYYSFYPSPRNPPDPYRRKMQQRRILSSVIRDLP